MPRYETDPIVEALCEFAFASTAQWDPTVFGAFRSAVGDAVLPIREAGEVVDVLVETTEEGVRQHTRRLQRMRFFSADRSRLAQVGENLLIANVLRPYPHWGPFRAFILQTLEAYESAAKPDGIDRLTLRYIDKLPLGADGAPLGEWIRFESPYLPAFLADAVARGFSRVEKPVVGGTEALTLVLEEHKGERVLTLDTELVVAPHALDRVALAATLDALHERVVEIFEACISDRTRAMLRPLGD
ncbi:MAG: TIGR04255 family protein [Polyangiales bacterium]|nr:TIGR04255 family protein [Myxococcales bacterium]MCB9656777.1 TIGR04255 family protein [Sandaracinaceae bacterium]